MAQHGDRINAQDVREANAPVTIAAIKKRRRKQYHHDGIAEFDARYFTKK
jgi:hypothetical protein